MIADDYRGIREAMQGDDEKPMEPPKRGPAADMQAAASDLFVRRWYIRRAREQSERMKR